MKAKARDIVHGWPTGRSTSSSDWREEVERTRLRLDLRGVNRRDAHQLICEAARNVKYHEDQARMMEDWRLAQETRPDTIGGGFRGPIVMWTGLNFGTPGREDRLRKLLM